MDLVLLIKVKIVGALIMEKLITQLRIIMSSIDYLHICKENFQIILLEMQMIKMWMTPYKLMMWSQIQLQSLLSNNVNSHIYFKSLLSTIITCFFHIFLSFNFLSKLYYRLLDYWLKSKWPHGSLMWFHSYNKITLIHIKICNVHYVIVIDMLGPLNFLLILFY